MYDFYLGTQEEIKADPKKYLLTIKRMMPRWCNCIPDSEYLALYDLLAEHKFPKNPILVETGSGASSIVLCYFALLTDGELYTWDISGSKLFYLRSILNDTLMRYFNGKNLSNHWKYIAYDSNSEYAGINMLKELEKKVSACFFDSEHTLSVLMREIRSICELLAETAIVAIDDGNYNYRHQNLAYINMLRKKHDLPAIEDFPDNIGRSFWLEVNDYLIGKFKSVEYLADNYKKNYKADIFWDYYKNEREVTNKLSMEKSDDLEHRFDAWRVKTT